MSFAERAVLVVDPIAVRSDGLIDWVFAACVQHGIEPKSRRRVVHPTLQARYTALAKHAADVEQPSLRHFATAFPDQAVWAERVADIGLDLPIHSRLPLPR